MRRKGKAEAALVLLSKMFNHSSIAITRRYIGLSKEQIDDVYTSIDFLMGKKISGGDIGLMIEPNPAYIKALVQKELIPTQKSLWPQH